MTDGFQPAGYQPSGFQPDGWQPEAPSGAPTLSANIPSIAVDLNSGAHSYDLAQYFSGATSYAIDPVVESGWSFDAGTGLLSIDTDDDGVFGSYIVTATNGDGSTPSNSFTVTVREQSAGGWLFLKTYEYQLSQRRADERRRQEIEEETEQIEEPVTREIAQLFREQEAIDAENKADEALLALARANADIERARQYSVAVAEAYQEALERGLEGVERLRVELAKAREEEDFLVMSILLLDQ